MKIHAGNANLSDGQSGVAGCFHRGACAATAMLALTATSVHAQEWLTISAHLPSLHPTLVCYSPDGKLLATNGNVKANGPGGMRLWEAKSGKMLLDITTWNSQTTDLGTYNLGAYRYRLLLTERGRSARRL